MVFEESFGSLYKLFIVVCVQVMFFDFKFMNVICFYFVSFVYVDVLDYLVLEDEILFCIVLVYEGNGGKFGIFGCFVNNVSKVELLVQVLCILQVVNVQVSLEVFGLLFDFLKFVFGVLENWVVDLVGEVIFICVGVFILFFSKGYVIGNVMFFCVFDGVVWDFKLFKFDYEISVDFIGFKKVRFSEVEGGVIIYVYGVYGGICLIELLGNKVYLDIVFKNGELCVILVSQDYVDDFLYFYDVFNGMFVKLVQVIDGWGDEKWFKSVVVV